MLICANVNQLPTNHLLITQHLCWLNRLIHRLTAYFLAPSITWAEVTRAARVGGGDLGVSIGIPINQHNQFKPFSSHSISISFNPISVYSSPPLFLIFCFLFTILPKLSTFNYELYFRLHWLIHWLPLVELLRFKINYLGAPAIGNEWSVCAFRYMNITARYRITVWSCSLAWI